MIPPVVATTIVLLLAVSLDLVFGEPPLRVHPTIMIGKMIRFGVSVTPRGGAKSLRLYGTALALGVIVAFAGGSFLILKIAQMFGQPVEILAAALLLKPTFSIRLMRSYARKLACAIQEDDWATAKAILKHIVRRNPEQLTPTQMISAGVESVAENTTDGITSPLFYYALFGAPGALAYRAINTLDSMIGYKDPKFFDLGWFSAKIDSAANWIPARITALLTIVSSGLLGLSATGAYRILRRDRRRTESVNAGWTMSATAGALKVQLEKSGSYALGDPNRALSAHDLIIAIRLMVVNTGLFVLFVALPLIYTFAMLKQLSGP